MAKIETIKYDIQGVEFKAGIYVGKAGVFELRMDSNHRELIGLELRDATTLKELKDAFYKAIGDYVERKTTNHLELWYTFCCSGFFAPDRNPVRSSRFSAGSSNELSLDYKVMWAETVEGRETRYYKADKRPSKDDGRIWLEHYENLKSEEIDGYKKANTHYAETLNHNEKSIPFHPELLVQLKKLETKLGLLGGALYDVFHAAEGVDQLIMSHKLLH